MARPTFSRGGWKTSATNPTGTGAGSGWTGIGGDKAKMALAMQNFGCYMINTGGSAPGNAILCAEYGATESIVNNMRAGWTAIRNQLRIVSNSTRATPAGKTAAGTYSPALYPAPTPIAVAH